MQSYLCSDTSHPYTYRDFPVSLAQDQLHVRENYNRVSFISVLIVFFFFFGGRGEPILVVFEVLAKIQKSKLADTRWPPCENLT